MKTIITLLLISLLSFSAHSQIDSIRGNFKVSNLTNFFKRKTPLSINNKLSNNQTSINVDSSFGDTTSIKTVKLDTSTKSLKKTDTLLVNDANNKLIGNEFIKKMKFPVDTSQKSINIFIVGSSNVDLNISSGGMLTVNKTPAFNGQLLNSMLNGEVKKKGFLSDMDAGKLTSLVTLVLASLPLIISSFK